MGTVEKATRTCFYFLEKFRKFAVYVGENKNIRKKASLVNNVKLSQEQKEEIDNFFIKNYGMKYSHKWHKLYQSYTGIYRKDYFPELLFSTKLEPELNDYYFAKNLDDKNLLELFFNQSKYVRVPLTLTSCINGIYRGTNNSIISKSKAIELIGNIGEAVIKKSVDTSSGRDVMLCIFVNGVDVKTNQTVEDIVNKIGDNFIVQERISQCKDSEKLYSKSLNTFRIVTYIIDDEIFVCPISLRMGRNNAEVDNVHFGGITVGVSQNGELKKQAFSEFQERFLVHPDSGVRFEGHKINGIDKLVKGAKELHSFIPHLQLISWDLCLDKEEKAVLIEMNTIGQSVWFPQMVNGEPMFGDNTAYMLKKISDSKE